VTESGSKSSKPKRLSLDFVPRTLDKPVLPPAFEPAELEAFLEDFLRVCTPGPLLVIGSGVQQVVRAMLARGLDAHGFETGPREVGFGHGVLRCQKGDALLLPFADNSFESVFVSKALDHVPAAELNLIFIELCRVTRRNLILQTATSAAKSLDPSGAVEPRRWWDGRFLENGFRKHPLRSWLIPYETLDHEGAELILAFERLMTGSKESPPMSDPSRTTGGAADAFLAWYEVAANSVRPWDRVLDLGCGSGCGTYLMERLSRGGQFLGVDESDVSIAYAKSHFGLRAPNIEFRRAAPLDLLRQCKSDSFHFVVCSNDSFHSAPAEFASEILRVLAPGGRFLISLPRTGQTGASPQEEQGDRAGLLHSIPGRFLVERLLELNMASDLDGSPRRARRLQPVSAQQAARFEADWIVALLMKDPLQRELPPYEETVFANLDGSDHVSIQYKKYYQNPWMLHSLMHASYRANSPQIQADCAWGILATARPESVDAGAALCLLLYRLMDGQLPDGCSEDSLLARIEDYLAITCPNPLQLRWQISLSSALGGFHMRRGDFDAAKRAFVFCTGLDSLFCIHLSGKTAEAFFWLGWMALSEEDDATAARMWRKGMHLGDRILGRSLDQTVMQPEWPNLFDYGDGLREVVHALETVAMCANGVHCLRLKRQGISYRWDLIPNTFRAQQQNRERLLRQAQFRVGRLCSEIDGLRPEVERLRSEVDRLRNELAERTHELERVLVEKELNQTLQAGEALVAAIP
jgi:SAM-dependent methyltransferase